MGIIARIVRGYTFLSRNYEPGDRIYIIGFSRGAYTARALGGLICKVGLLNPKTYDPKDKVKAYRLATAAWAKAKAKTVGLQGTSRWTTIANRALGLVEDLFALQLPPNGLIENVPIHAIGVWDTVGSLGIPAYDKDSRYDMFRFVDSDLSSTVALGFHAMAIDERRIDFPVTRWTPRDGVEQVWFVGAHADAGGGYPQDESRLSDTALSWMLNKLSTAGLQLSNPLTYTPKPLTTSQSIHKPWNDPPFNLGNQVSRDVSLTDTFHASVVDHWQADNSYTFARKVRLAQADINALKLDRAVLS